MKLFIIEGGLYFIWGAYIQYCSRLSPNYSGIISGGFEGPSMVPGIELSSVNPHS